MLITTIAGSIGRIASAAGVDAAVLHEALLGPRERAAERPGVDHTDIADLDDVDRNLEPAEALGWTTIHVVDPLDALAELRALVGVDRNRSLDR